MKYISILMLIFMMACNQNQQDQNESEADPETGNNEVEATSANQELNEPTIQNITQAYLNLKQSLVDAQVTDAKAAAESIVNSLKNEQNLSGKVENMMNDAAHIASKEDISHQREHFKSLSDNLYQVVKSSGANQQTLYWQYCPMAFDNQGASWLNASSEITNPYFGDQMLKCGTTKETLN